ncbi:MAG: hypothetical protein ACRBCI_10295 [Cellvibrionaceae bacterium]
MKTTLYILLLIASTIGSHIAYADTTYICLFNGDERMIKVAYTYSDSTVPCEVIYEKNTGSQVLWSAQSEAGYCEAKAVAFVEKQRGWGWDCAQLEAPAEPAVENPVLKTE